MLKSIALGALIIFGLNSSKAYSGIFNFKDPNSRECTRIDLRGEALGEVRHQGYVGWCFAHATADLVSYKLKKRISPVDIGINFYDKMPEMPRDAKLSTASGGNDLGAISYSSAGYCEEEFIAGENFQIESQCQSLVDAEISSIIIFLEKLFDHGAISLNYCQKNIIKSLFKNISEVDLNSVASTNQKTSLQKIAMLKDLNCKSKRLNSQKMSMKGGFNNDPLVDIDQQLNLSNPISLNYNAGFLMKDKKDSNEFYNHYSTIVGRRKVASGCQYLVRNSWGKDCSIYPSPYNKQCEDGNIWVDEVVLRQSLIGIKYLK